MFGKINLGYGGVEVTEDSINILTKPQPMSSTDGVQYEEVTCKRVQSSQLSYVAQFLSSITSGSVYVEPLDVGLRGMFQDVTFRVSGEYFLHVMVGDGGILYTTLIQPTSDGGISPIKFTYEGEIMEGFFSEIKMDITNLF